MENNFKGLSKKEVEKKILLKQINDVDFTSTKSYLQIIKDNVFTIFNLYNFLIFITLVAIKAYTNSLFFIVILANVLSSIFQEIKAKIALDNLTFNFQTKVKILRDGSLKLHTIKEILKDDIIQLESNMQAMVDGEIIKGDVEVDESSLSGEANIISKKAGDSIISGSIILTGKCFLKVLKVGKDTHLYKIEEAAKKSKNTQTKITKDLNKIIKINTIIIPFIFTLLLIEGFLRNEQIKPLVISSCTAVLGLLPKGIIFLLTVILSIFVYKLAKQKVMVKDLNSLQRLSYIDMIFFDKTGTLTNSQMKVSSLNIINNLYDEDTIKIEIASFLSCFEEINLTAKAMIKEFGLNKRQYLNKVPFISSRKYSSVTFSNDLTYIMCAPEIILNKKIKNTFDDVLNQNKRTLVFASCKNYIDKNTNITEINFNVIATISFDEEIRDGASDIIDYFKKQNIKVKILSGDSVASASYIAKKCGIENFQTTSFDSIKDLNSDKEFKTIIEKTNVFGRMTPSTKEKIISYSKKLGYNVAMVGDGINDILALKAADCSISIYNKSKIVNDISQIVILDGNVDSLKTIMNYSRSIVNNITNMGGVFFLKTIYSFFIALGCILTNISFPFYPLQIILIDLFIEGLPGFLLSLKENNNAIKKDFLKESLKLSLHSALIVSLLVIVIENFLVMINKNQNFYLSTSFILLSIFSIYTLYKSLKPYNSYKIFILFICVFMFSVCSLILNRLLIS